MRYDDHEPCNCCGYHHVYDVDELPEEDKERAIWSHIEAGDVPD